MNPFQLDYTTRFLSWYELRDELSQQNLTTTVSDIDAYWQQVPLAKHHLHWYDQDNWPSPWQLMDDNIYCELAKALGICYTLLLIGIESGYLAQATDNQGVDCYIVVVINNSPSISSTDAVKYIMSYHPNTVLHNELKDFKINDTIQLSHLKNKIK